MKTQLKKIQKGFTLVEIMIVVAIIGLLVAIALPNFMIARKKSQIKAAQASMKQIGGAIEQARLDDVAALCTGGALAQNVISGALVTTYLKVWPNTPGTLTVTSDGTNDTINVLINGINGNVAFTAYDTVTP